MSIDKKQIRKLLRSYLNGLDEIFFSYADQLPRLEITKKLEIQVQENDLRNCIYFEWSNGLYDIIYQIFDNVHQEVNCYICQQTASKCYNCPNNHSEVLCMDCVFDMLTTDNDTCGLCREPIKISSDNLGVSMSKFFTKKFIDRNKDSVDNCPILRHIKKCHQPDTDKIEQNMRMMLICC